MPIHRKANPQLVKIHRSYAADELAVCLGIHVNTVRNWMDAGLEPIDGQRPYLFHGADVRTFIKRQRACAKRPCGHGELYCLRCRAPKRPAAGMADYVPITASSGDLEALCQDCEGVMHQRVTLQQMKHLEAILSVEIRPKHCA